MLDLWHTKRWKEVDAGVILWHTKRWLELDADVRFVTHWKVKRAWCCVWLVTQWRVNKTWCPFEGEVFEPSLTHVHSICDGEVCNHCTYKKMCTWNNDGNKCTQILLYWNVQNVSLPVACILCISRLHNVCSAERWKWTSMMVSCSQILWWWDVLSMSYFHEMYTPQWIKLYETLTVVRCTKPLSYLHKMYKPIY